MSDVVWPPIPPDQIVGLLRSYSEDDRHAGNGFSAAVHDAAADEIERLRAMPCPYVRTSDEGTSYCSLGTA